MGTHLLDLMKLQGEIRVLLLERMSEQDSEDAASTILHMIATSKVASEQHREAYARLQAGAK